MSFLSKAKKRGASRDVHASLRNILVASNFTLYAGMSAYAY